MLDKSKIHLFEMNEYDWVAAENEEEANEWYEQLTGEKNDIDEINEVSLETTFLCLVDETDENELNQGFERETISGEEYIKIPFSHSLKHMPDNIMEPWIVKREGGLMTEQMTKDLKDYFTDLMIEIFKDEGYKGSVNLAEHTNEDKGEYIEHRMIFKDDKELDTIVNFRTKEIGGKIRVYSIRIF